MQAKLDLWWAAGKPAQVEVFEGVGLFEIMTAQGSSVYEQLAEKVS